jgi:hypothetical protein
MGFTYQTYPIVGGTVLIIERVQSQNYSAGVAGWAIEADGDAEFNNLIARGSLLVGNENAQHILIALDPSFPFRPTMNFYTGSGIEAAPGQIQSSDTASAQHALIIDAPAATGALGGAQIFMATEAGIPGRIDLTAAELFFNASDSILVARPIDFETAWKGTAVTPLAGTWVDVAGARFGYLKDASGRVSVRGKVSGGGAGATVVTLPVGYRPSSNLDFTMRSGTTLCAVGVSTGGVLTVTANLATATVSGINLDVISYPTI